MLRRFVAHVRSQWMGALALFLVIAGGTAYAANTVFSTDIVNGEVKSVDIGTDEVRSVDLRNDNLSGGGLRSVDIANAASGSDDVNANRLDGIDSSGLVQGRGKLLANRFIMQPDTPDRTLFEIPGFGRLHAHCETDNGRIVFTNTTNGDIDLWLDALGNPSHEVIHPFGIESVAFASDGAGASTLALGFGDDPGARRTATVHLLVTQAGTDDPCVFQAQGMLWTHP